MSDLSILRPVGNPWTMRFVLILTIASVLVTAAVCSRDGIVNVIAILYPLAAAILAVMAWYRFSRGAISWAILAVSAVVAGFGLSQQSPTAAEVGLLVVTYVLIALYQLTLRAKGYSIMVVVPILVGLLFLDTASLIGQTGSGGFPAAFGVLLTLIVLATRELELRTPVSEDSNQDPHVHLLHRKALGWISIVFFLFGVVCFWPWLGKMYGDAYFWILVLGVLSPLLYLWGRLRQPRHQNSLAALRRFNRLVPYLGLIMLVAIAIG